MATTTELLTVTQVAAELALTRRAVLHRIRNGTLAATKLGDGLTSAYVITSDEVERAKASQTSES